MIIDESTPLGELAARHLREDRVVWLTTVSSGGAPQPSPVWFLWDGAERVRMYSLPGTPRTRNLEANPNVSLNFAGDAYGGDIVVLSGRATVEPSGSAEADVEYVEKYGWGFERIGVTPAQFAARYSVPVSIDLTKLRGHK